MIEKCEIKDGITNFFSSSFKKMELYVLSSQTEAKVEQKCLVVFFY